MKEEMRQKFIEILGNNRVLFDEPMSQHTTFRIGGPADVFAMPENYEQIREVLRLCKEEKLPFFVLGNGSNLLVSDSGYRGVIIQMDRNMEEIRLDGEEIHGRFCNFYRDRSPGCDLGQLQYRNAAGRNHYHEGLLVCGHYQISQ